MVLKLTDSSFLLANAQIVDFPIVYCNESFCKISGYNRAEVMQKSCRYVCGFMYGELTDKETVGRLEYTLENQQQDQFEILLYKKNNLQCGCALSQFGKAQTQETPLWLLLQVAPIRNERDLVVLFLLTFRDITALKQPIDSEDTKGGLSKFAKLARSVTRSRQFSAHLPTLKDPTKQSNLAHVPYNVAFKNKTSEDVSLLVVDSIVDVIFFIDIVLNFHTTFVGPGGEVVSDPKVIRMNYLKSWFIIDLLSCLPYDCPQGRPPASAGACGAQAGPLPGIRCGHADTPALLLHAGGPLAGLHLVFDRAQRCRQWDSVQLAVEAGQCDAISVLVHMEQRHRAGIGERAVTEEHVRDGPVLYHDVHDLALLYATIFGHVTTIIQQMTSATAKYHDMLNNVREFMKLHEVPKALSERVMDYVVSTWAMTKGLDTEKVLNYCPKDMKADICVHLNRKVFNEHPAFRLASDGCLRALAMHFMMSHSAPGDLLYHTGESIDSLCFIVTGSLEVIQDDEVVAILGKGDVFGDQFWKDSAVGQSAANVRALTYCDLHAIKRDKLLEVLDFYSAFANSFARNLVLTYNLRHRLIFRKVADVKREKELAERRKNEPQLPQNQDHLVRKIFSKFRRTPQVQAGSKEIVGGSGQSDVEKGDGEVERTKVFPKAPKLQASQATLARQDTIDEGGEVDSSPPSRDSRVVIEGGAAAAAGAAGSTGGSSGVVATIETGGGAGPTKAERNLALERERQIEMASSRATTSDTYDTGLRETPPTLAQRDLIATVLDMKVDVRLELQRMQQRIGRIEDLLGELVKRLAPPGATPGGAGAGSAPDNSSGQTTPGDEICAGCGAGGGGGGAVVTPTTTTTQTLIQTPSVVTSPVDTVITISSPGGSGQGQESGAGTGTGTGTGAGAGAGGGLLNPGAPPVSSAGGNGLGPLMLKKRRSKSRKAPAPPKQTLASSAGTATAAPMGSVTGSGTMSAPASADHQSATDMSPPGAATAAAAPAGQLLHLRLLEEDFTAAQLPTTSAGVGAGAGVTSPTAATTPTPPPTGSGSGTPTTTPTGSGPRSSGSKREFL
ncbi:potassium voltage-gated channel protein eag [Drosophila kikkawai]|uniref:Potassium voltage-gated channel protein eag n=1 Tax=Drosophila kikkawai TaxID=30033 RepID=A0ABM4GPM5_DROKI